MKRFGSLPEWISLLLCVLLVLMIACVLVLGPGSSRPGNVQDEAMQAGRLPQSFPQSDVDYFHDMDGGVQMSLAEVRGRNMWIVWSGGNDRFWDKMSTKAFGYFDLLKTISSYPQAGDPKQSLYPYGRHNRWKILGLVNQPCFKEASQPDPVFGLYLDVPVAGPNCPADPFADEAKYPGVKFGARGTAVYVPATHAWAHIPVGSFYGYPTGIVGLRLFPNPYFDAEAAKKWDPKRYYSDPKYYLDDKVVRPFRVGMSCGFCHVGPSPIHPPADPENPQWADLSSTVGAQFMWVDRLFMVRPDEKNFIFQLVHTYRPGSMDTSLVSTDNINNPRTMNAIYKLLPRLANGGHYGHEIIAGGELNNKQLNDYTSDPALTQFFAAPDKVGTPHVLKDGSDSVGVLGALNRVYLNIGLFSEEWLLHFNAVVGGKPITPIEIAVANKNSSYWLATENGTFDMALALARASDPYGKARAPDRLAEAPGGATYLNDPSAQLDRGKSMFAENCAMCHSSKAPKGSPLEKPDCIGPKYLDCFYAFLAWSKTPFFRGEMQKIVHAPDFLDGNYLSTEARIPVTYLQTNICSPLASNAIAGNIWDNFSSHSYKSLPSAGTMTLRDPMTGKPFTYTLPAGGRGYTRPASLAALWSTAPFLLNNSVGHDPDVPAYPSAYASGEIYGFNSDPSVAARMRVFQNSIEQMLWPEKRDKDDKFGSALRGRIDRTTAQSYIKVSDSYLPDFLKGGVMSAIVHFFFPWIESNDGVITIGPIPKGVPVGLLANIRPLPETTSFFGRIQHSWRLVKLVYTLQKNLNEVHAKGITDNDALIAQFQDLEPQMLALDKCRDFVVNRGHYFGTKLSDDDKHALIAFLKTF